MTTESAAKVDSMEPGQQLDAMIAETVFREAQPAIVHGHSHIEPIPSPGGNWVCCQTYERGDVCEWVPLPFSSQIAAAWRIVQKLEAIACRFETADGFIHLSCGHWADHGDCIERTTTAEEEKQAEDPSPWSFHIHLGMLAANDECPPHWRHGQRFCASARTAPLAICLAVLESLPERTGMRRP